ncbi:MULTISPECIES: YciI family protein [Dyella]|uniref:YciI family protein n=2 Tax=Dyella TaxID=231454 RepID=A0A4R0YRT0_9GAMM|nr:MULTISPECIES: YciI family protein [Dyella]TBR40517.1 YciI family protein [Dyella terrae]TCI11902.1 YciI family protein [Dyella soli]
MKYLVMIYCDDALLSALPEGEFDTMMRGCFAKADAMKAEGTLKDSQQLEHPEQSRTIRVRQGRTSIVDGPFAETKEYLGGFNLIEADSMDEAIQIASAFPWASIGSIEIRPVREMAKVRERVGAAEAA